MLDVPIMVAVDRWKTGENLHNLMTYSSVIRRNNIVNIYLWVTAVFGLEFLAHVSGDQNESYSVFVGISRNPTLGRPAKV